MILLGSTRAFLYRQENEYGSAIRLITAVFPQSINFLSNQDPVISSAAVLVNDE